jgi:hypothetical protein
MQLGAPPPEAINSSKYFPCRFSIQFCNNLSEHGGRHTTVPIFRLEIAHARLHA